MDTDTIAAISTPIGEGAIGIVRLSGKDSIPIVDRLFKSPSGKRLKDAKTHTIHYGHLYDGDVLVEEVMVSVMKGPKTFTREDVVEINCHGGIVSVNRVLETVLANGARLAEPGEFTKRAFMNGRIDLSQAEAIMDLIRAKTDRAMNVALGQMEGRLSRMIRKLRSEILEVLAQVEVNIDYPEYDDVEEMTHKLLKEKALFVKQEISRLLDTAKQGKILREGVATAIIGRPNVGKSSLLNSFARENKAIVTDIPGTTRDVIEEYVNIKGVPLKLIDTAGIRETDDTVERIGVERSRKVVKEADLILFVLSNNEQLTEEDRLLFQMIQGMEAIIVINKTDLPTKIDIKEVERLAEGRPIVYLSLMEDRGLEQLENTITSKFFSGEIETNDFTYVSNARHISLLKEALKSVDDVLNGIEAGIPVDILQIDMTKIWETLGEITGDTVHDELINQLFSQFCLGK
ncbi:tRNA uridine-5-carboxymethylaminomethyl(34) synthesis GTPase MnmE [Fervidibacillus halotolerans]|uniref:tRNA modification GTPase MnmE n=1 Tax=Fervidibacillus halotolerans TaxID=2980027 RepID=A0A9E8LYU6_9BACI|nr:tRNA uridine-5-carboxymethylaminomethyl(34) synthesis GTPase MnmE [Fervidibacillus halotolerans]WAA12293.1 tRNA uridine-5-carboxymethylaminomethyl(34) synthesis GTPase MnmE [Fervidibacillus halotolerans]